MASNVEEHILKLRDEMSRGLEKVNSNVNKMRGGVEKSTQSFGNMSRVAVRAFAAIGGAAAAVDIVKTTANYESLDTTIKFLSGSTEEYAKNQKFLRDTSENLGFGLLDATESFKTLAGGMVGTGIEGQELRDIYEGVSVGLRATGASAEQAKGAMLALGQMASKGTVSAEELRGQLGERMPGAFAIAADAMGVTTERLGKMLEQGMIPAADFLPKFANKVRSTFADAIPEATKTANFQFGRLQTTILDIKLAIGENLLPVVLDWIKILQEQLLPWVKENRTWLKNTAITIGILVLAYKAMQLWLKAVALAQYLYNLKLKQTIIWQAAAGVKSAWLSVRYGLLAAQQWYLNIAMDANPIGAIILAITALTAAVIYVTTNYESWTEAVKDNTKELILGMGAMGAMVVTIAEIADNWDHVTDAFTDDGLAAGIKTLGLVIGDALLSPVQAVVDSLAELTGFEWLENLSGKIKTWREVAQFGIEAHGDTEKATAAYLAAKEAEKFVTPGTSGLNPNMIDLTGGGPDFLNQFAGAGTGLGSSPIDPKSPIDPEANNLGSGLATVKAGAPKTINININSLIDELSFKTTNLRESAAETKDVVTKVLLDALNDAQVIGR